jgi:phosphate starvation-inducible PhoH-like protein
MNSYIFYIFLSFGLFSFSFQPKQLLKQSIQLLMKKSKIPNSELYNSLSKNTFYTPKTNNQKLYVDSLTNEDNKIIIAIGPAGTGKTLFACQHAISQLKSDKIQKIIITRPVISVEEELGFLPGNIQNKMDPWLKPIYDVFLQTYNSYELKSLIQHEIIEICPLAFMRGRTFKNAFLIADEMQNSSPNQMKMLTTRIGDNSKMVITGDLNQSDLLKENGLSNLINNINNYNQFEKIEMITQIYFDTDDIQRSDIVKKLIEIYDFNIIDNNNNNSIYDLKQQKYIFNKNTTDSAIIPNNHITENYYKFLTFMER